ncbi:MAG: 6-phosphogluconolactonase [Candidatus Saganbacteria bacterium]|nr:6-phosphogluconolactonase [Candidatus Saganbacteria bacterium]
MPAAAPREPGPISIKDYRQTHSTRLNKPDGLILRFKPYPHNPNFTVEVYGYHEEYGGKRTFPAAQKIAARLILAQAMTGRGTVLTPGCTTPIEMYRQLYYACLEKGFKLGDLLTGKVGKFYMGMIDGVEYPLSHPVNFRTYFIEFFLRRFGKHSPLLISDPVEREKYIAETFAQLKHVYVPHIPLDATNGEKMAYVAEFLSWVEARSPIDLIVCGLGPDGHIAFLEPGQTYGTALPVKRVELWDGIRIWKWANEDPSCACARLGNCDLLGPPRHALTITQNVFMEAGQVVLIATGKEKAQAVQRLVNGQSNPQNFPAHFLREAKGRVTLLLDPAAASLLDIQEGQGNRIYQVAA